MYCISTRTTGRTWPNTRLPSRASSSSLDCHCITRERNDENVSHWIFGGTDWKRRAWRRPRWVVAALSRSEEHTSELQSQSNLVCRLLLEKKKHAQYGTVRR